jgi:hypothetical protein
MAGADPQTANLIHIDPEGNADVAAEGLVFPKSSPRTARP